MLMTMLQYPQVCVYTYIWRIIQTHTHAQSYTGMSNLYACIHTCVYMRVHTSCKCRLPRTGMSAYLCICSSMHICMNMHYILVYIFKHAHLYEYALFCCWCVCFILVFLYITLHSHNYMHVHVRFFYKFTTELCACMYVCDLHIRTHLYIPSLQSKSHLRNWTHTQTCTHTYTCT